VANVVGEIDVDIAEVDIHRGVGARHGLVEASGTDDRGDPLVADGAWRRLPSCL
jgi:hypothetical protein